MIDVNRIHELTYSYDDDTLRGLIDGKHPVTVTRRLDEWRVRLVVEVEGVTYFDADPTDGEMAWHKNLLRKAHDRRTAEHDMKRDWVCGIVNGEN